MKNETVRHEQDQDHSDELREQILRELLAVQEESKGVEAERCCGPRCHCGTCSM